MSQLREIFRRLNVRQVDLARALNTTEATISRYAAGTRKPSNGVLAQIAAYLNVEIEELSGDVPLLSTDEREALRLFRDMGPEQRNAALTVLRTLTSAERRDQPADDKEFPFRKDRT